jgi:hypothetical protein
MRIVRIRIEIRVFWRPEILNFRRSYLRLVVSHQQWIWYVVCVNVCCQGMTLVLKKGVQTFSEVVKVYYNRECLTCEIFPCCLGSRP